MSAAAAKKADKPALKAVKSGDQFGRTVSLLGAVRGADLMFDDGTVYKFTVDGLLCATMEMDPDEDVEGLSESMLVDACFLGRARMREDDPDNPHASLPIREFLRRLLPGSRMHLVPDYDELEADEAGLLQEGHPFGSAQS